MTIAYQPATGPTIPMQVTVLAEETPGMYRVSTTLGIALLMAEASLTPTPAQTTTSILTGILQ